MAAPSPSVGTTVDDLPEFDDGEAKPDPPAAREEASPLKASPLKQAAASQPRPADPTPVKAGTGLSSRLAEEVGGNVEGLDEDTILGAMRGKDSSWAPPPSIQDTLRDRSLERLMDFDAMVDRDGGTGGGAAELPEFEEVIARRRARGDDGDGPRYDPTLGKKAQRTAQRRAAAVRREEELEAERSPLEGVLEDFDFLDLISKGAWVGIGLLVVWEFYINSPFFDRAAPLIPVVYDKVPPGM